MTYHVFAPELIREDGTTFADDTDVIVVGTGAGGFTAAITAANNGARVIQLEKAQTIGGTTKKAAAAAREVEAMGEPGLALIERFLHRTIAHRSQLVLPTHGVPPSQSEEISRLRAEVREIMTRILKRGNKDGTVRADFSSSCHKPPFLRSHPPCHILTDGVMSVSYMTLRGGPATMCGVSVSPGPLRPSTADEPFGFVCDAIPRGRRSKRWPWFRRRRHR